MDIIKIIIVDDHKIFRKGLKTLLNDIDNFKVVGEASNGEEFLELMDTVNADIVLMDIKMPGIDGIEATYKAIKKKPDTKVIALTMFGEQEYCSQMTDVGVYGFLLKDAEPEVIKNAILEVMKGKNYFSQEVIDGMKIFKKNEKTGKRRARKIGLSERELKILQYLCDGLQNEAIGEKLNISHRTVEGHRANLLDKTGVKNSVGLILYAIKNDLVTIKKNS